jgi:hypothetical protein
VRHREGPGKSQKHDQLSALGFAIRSNIDKDEELSGSSQWLLEATVEGGAGRKPKRSGARPVDRPRSINDVMLQREGSFCFSSAQASKMLAALGGARGEGSKF